MLATSVDTTQLVPCGQRRNGCINATQRSHSGELVCSTSIALLSRLQEQKLVRQLEGLQRVELW